MSGVIDVEANSVEEAIAKATAAVDFRPCHQCNDSPAEFVEVPSGYPLTSCLRCEAVIGADRTAYHDAWHAEIMASTGAT